MTAKIHNDHAFFSGVNKWACYMFTCLLLNKISFLNVCINLLLGLCGAWQTYFWALKGPEKALNFVLPKVY